MITTEQKLRCAERELAMRRRVYPRWIEQGRISAATADTEIRMMEAIAEDYRAQARTVTPSLFDGEVQHD